MQGELLDQLKDREAMAWKWFSPMEMLEKMQDMFLSGMKSAPK